MHMGTEVPTERVRSTCPGPRSLTRWTGLALLVFMALWVGMNQPVGGENAPPELTQLELSDNQVYRGQNIGLILNGTDDNTTRENLTAQIELTGGRVNVDLSIYPASDDIVSIALSTDGEYVVAGSRDGTVQLIRQGQDEPLWNYSTEGSVYSVDISGDGRFVVAASYGGSLYLFERSSDIPLWNFSVGGYLFPVAISKDGSRIALGGSGNRLYLFDRDNSTPRWDFTADDAITSMAITADGDHLVVASYFGVFYHFDTDTSTPLWANTTNERNPVVDISDDGAYIIAGSYFYGDTIFLFGQASNVSIESYDLGHTLRSLAISASGDLILGGSLFPDNTIYLFSRENTSEVREYQISHTVYSVAISDNEEFIIASSADDRLFLFRTNDSLPVWTHSTDGTVIEVGISANADIFAAGSYDNHTYLFDRWQTDLVLIRVDDHWEATIDAPLSFETGDYTLRARLVDDEGVTSAWNHINFRIRNSPPLAVIDTIVPEPVHDTQTITLIGHGTDIDGSVLGHRWTSDIDGLLSIQAGFMTKLSSGEHTITYRVMDSDGEWSDDVTVSLDVRANAPPVLDHLVLSGSHVGRGHNVTISLKGHDELTGDEGLVPYLEYSPPLSQPVLDPLISSHEVGYTRSSAISADGEYHVLGTGSVDEKLQLFRRGQAEPVWTYQADDDINAVDISADGYFIAAGSNDAVVYLFDRLDHRPRWTWTLEELVMGVSLSADGSYLTVWTTMRFYLFDVLDGSLEWDVRTISALHSVAISAGGGSIAVSTIDGKVCLYSPDSNQILWEKTFGATPILSMSSNGQYLVVTKDDSVHLFQTKSGKALWNTTLDSQVYDLAISADGRFIVASSFYDNLYLFSTLDRNPLWNYTAMNNLEVAISADGSFISACNPVSDQLLYFWNSLDEPIWSWTSSYNLKSIAMSADGSHLVARGNNNLYSFQFDLWTDEGLSDIQYANGQWQADLSVPLNSSLSNISFRARLADPYDGLCPWFYTNSSLAVVNDRPRAYIDENPGLAQVGAMVNLSGHGIDGDGMIIARRWLSSLDGYLLDDADISLSNLSLGDHLIAFQVRDNDGTWSEPETCSLRIIVNGPPVTTALDILTDRIPRGENLTLMARGTDEEALRDLAAEFGIAFDDDRVQLKWDTTVHLTVNALAMTLDGRYIAVGTRGSYNITHGIHVFERHSPVPLYFVHTFYGVESLTFSPDGRYLAAILDNGSVALYEFGLTEPLWMPDPLGLEYHEAEVSVSEGGQYVLVKTHYRFYLFQRAKDAYTMIWDQSITQFSRVVMASDGSAFAYSTYGSYEWVVSVCLPGNIEPIYNVSLSYQVDKLAISSGGQFLVVTHTFNRTVQFFQLGDTKPRWVFETETETWKPIQRLELSSDGRYLAYVALTSNYSHILEVRDCSNGDLLWAYAPGPSIDRIAISSGGSYLAVGIEDKVRLYYNWDVASFSEPVFADGHWSSIFSFPTDANLGQYRFKARFWDSMGKVGVWKESNLTVELINNPPVAIFDIPQRINQGLPLPANGLDIDGILVGYRWLSSVDGEVGDEAWLDTDALSPGNHTLSLWVSDNDGDWSAGSSMDLQVNGRPIATILETPTEPVRKGSLIFLKGAGTDHDSPGGVVTYRWQIGPIDQTTYPREMGFDTGLLNAGNHTLAFQVRDSEGAWSHTVVTWLLINTPPRAVMIGLDHVRHGDRTLVTLWGEGLDEGTVVEYQWRSDIDGLLEGRGGLLVVDNLSAGTHTLSLRVKDDTGLWSNWVYYPETLAVKAREPSFAPRFPFLTEPPFYLYLLLAYLVVVGVWVVSRPLRHRWLAGQVKSHSKRLWDLQDQYISLGLDQDFPRHSFQSALEPLTDGYFWRSRDRLERLEREVDSAFSLFTQCHGLRRELKEETRVHDRRIRLACPPRRLERLEYLWLVRRLKEHKEETTRTLEDIRAAKRYGSRRQGIPEPGLRHLRRPRHRQCGRLGLMGHSLTPLGPVVGKRKRTGKGRNKG